MIPSFCKKGGHSSFLKLKTMFFVIFLDLPVLEALSVSVC